MTPTQFAEQVCADDDDPIDSPELAAAALHCVAHGALEIDPRDLRHEWQRRLHQLIVRSPINRTALGALADVVIIDRHIKAEFSAPEAFATWWAEAGMHAERRPPREVAEQLRALAHWRRLRAAAFLAAHAAEMRDLSGYIGAMRRAKPTVIELQALAGVRRAA